MHRLRDGWPPAGDLSGVLVGIVEGGWARGKSVPCIEGFSEGGGKGWAHYRAYTLVDFPPPFQPGSLRGSGLKAL